MKNAIKYYYNIYMEEINYVNDYYYFFNEEDKYYLVIYNRNINESKNIFELNKKMLNNNILVHEIIENKDKEIITIINDIPYILYKVLINENKNISLEEISYLSNSISLNKEFFVNWDILWMNKIDYFEYQINQIGKKYPLIVDSFSYFIGMSENAISYVKNTLNEIKKEDSDIGILSHKRIKNTDTIYELYNPLNIIVDHKARDLGEYIKLAFYQDNFNIWDELDEYFKYNYLSYYGIRLLFARILYPSFYFDLYEEIINNEKEEKEIMLIIDRINDYESYLIDIFNYLNKFYKLPKIEWLKK